MKRTGRVVKKGRVVKPLSAGGLNLADFLSHLKPNMEAVRGESRDDPPADIAIDKSCH
jgi:hypothetical protein